MSVNNSDRVAGAPSDPWQIESKWVKRLTVTAFLVSAIAIAILVIALTLPQSSLIKPNMIKAAIPLVVFVGGGGLFWGALGICKWVNPQFKFSW